MITELLTATCVVGGGVGFCYITSRSIEERCRRALAEPPPYKTRGNLVSVVVPSLNEEKNLPHLLKSLANQTYAPIEIIVVDSSETSSRQKVQAISEKFGAKYVFVEQLNVAHARNVGAEYAQGEILIFIDADCYLEHRYIEMMVTALRNSCLAHGVETVADGLYYSCIYGARAWLKPYNYTTGRGTAILRDCFNSIGGYNERLDPVLGYREDLDLGRRVEERYGSRSIRLLRDAGLVTWGLREKRFGFTSWSWRKVRGVRNGVIPV